MKTYLAALVLLISSIPVFGQDMAYLNTVSDSEIKITATDVLANYAVRSFTCPTTPGVNESACTRDYILDKLNANIEYPEIALEHNLEDNCTILFEVETSGKVGANKVQSCDASVYGPSISKALSSLQFEPAIEQGKKVKRIVQVSINFRLR